MHSSCAPTPSPNIPSFSMVHAEKIGGAWGTILLLSYKGVSTQPHLKLLVHSSFDFEAEFPTAFPIAGVHNSTVDCKITCSFKK